MMTPLRLGYLISGLLHAAVVAALSLSWQHEIPAVEQDRPLTLNLALFEPARATPVPPAPLKEPQAEPEAQVVEEPPPQPLKQQEDIEPLVEPLPTPVVKRTEPKPAVKPRKVVKQIRKPRPVIKKPIKARSQKPRQIESKPVVNAAASDPPAILPSVANPQAVTAAVDVREKQHYLAALAAKINRSKYYPLGSRRRGEEGKVVVRFVVQKNGDLTEITVVESSGSSRLDAAALNTLKRVTPFRPIPDALNRDSWPISVPIAFSLSG